MKIFHHRSLNLIPWLLLSIIVAAASVAIPIGISINNSSNCDLTSGFPATFINSCTPGFYIGYIGFLFDIIFWAIILYISVRFVLAKIIFLVGVSIMATAASASLPFRGFLVSNDLSCINPKGLPFTFVQTSRICTSLNYFALMIDILFWAVLFYFALRFTGDCIKEYFKNNE